MNHIWKSDFLFFSSWVHGFMGHENRYLGRLGSYILSVLGVGRTYI
jgi:hypothetical protein